jgi:hypothetical protein
MNADFLIEENWIGEIQQVPKNSIPQMDAMRFCWNDFQYVSWSRMP